MKITKKAFYKYYRFCKTSIRKKSIDWITYIDIEFISNLSIFL